MNRVFWISLIVTSVSNVESFVSQKFFVNFRSYRHDFNAFRFVSVAEFLCKQVEFLLESSGNKNFKSSNILGFGMS